jgi:ribosome-associated toxin RatA of RatAB toxin-antitoxin module
MLLLRYLFNKQTFKTLGFSLLSTALILGVGTARSFAADNGVLALSVAEPDAGNAKLVQAKVVINAPPAVVWQTITNYAEIKNILPGYEKSTVLKSAGSSKLLDIAVKVAAFLPTYKYKVQVREEESSYKLSLNRVSGDFKSLNATYRLIPQNNGSRTLLMYNLSIDPGFNLPGSQGIIKNSTEKSLRALERYTEQEAKKSLIGQR